MADTPSFDKGFCLHNNKKKYIVGRVRELEGQTYVRARVRGHWVSKFGRITRCN
jgi:hypothetical protein